MSDPEKTDAEKAKEAEAATAKAEAEAELTEEEQAAKDREEEQAAWKNTPDNEDAETDEEKAAREAAEEATAEQAEKEKAEAAEKEAAEAAAAEGGGGEKTPEEQAKERAEAKAAETAEAERIDQWWTDVERIHPDAEKTVASDEFQAWREKQTAEIKAKCTGEASAVDAIEVLNLYAKEKPEPATKEEKREEIAEFLARTEMGETDTGVKDDDGNPVTYAKLATDYPDVMHAMLNIGTRITADSVAGLEQRFEELLRKQGFVKQDELSDLNTEMRDARVGRSHPDWETFSQTDGFKTFFESQKGPIKALWESDKADDRISFLDLAKDKVTQATTEAARQERGGQRRTRQRVMSEGLRGAGGAPETEELDTATEREQETEAWKRVGEDID